MKKILMAALSAAVALTMSPCAFAEALPEEDYAGSYTGVAQGLGGDVTVTRLPKFSRKGRMKHRGSVPSRSRKCPWRWSTPIPWKWTAFPEQP